MNILRTSKVHFVYKTLCFTLTSHGLHGNFDFHSFIRGKDPFEHWSKFPYGTREPLDSFPLIFFLTLFLYLSLHYSVICKDLKNSAIIFGSFCEYDVLHRLHRLCEQSLTDLCQALCPVLACFFLPGPPSDWQAVRHWTLLTIGPCPPPLQKKKKSAVYSILLELASGLLESNCRRIQSITTGHSHTFHIVIVNLAVNIHKICDIDTKITLKQDIQAQKTEISNLHVPLLLFISNGAMFDRLV